MEDIVLGHTAGKPLQEDVITRLTNDEKLIARDMFKGHFDSSADRKAALAAEAASGTNYL